MTTLFPYEHRMVPPEYPQVTPCRIAIVGEAPDQHSAEKYRPFVGPSGSVLNAMLRCANIDREMCLVTNVFSYMLEDGSVQKERAKRGAGWDEYWQGNVKRLADELEAAKPTVVVPMGPTALLALRGTPTLSAHRGAPIMGVGIFSKYKLVPAFHPESINKQWSMFTVTIGDLLRASAEADKGPHIEHPKRTLNIAPSLREVEEYLAGPCRDTPLLSCDIETGWGQIRGVAFAPSQLEAIYVPFISLATINRSYWNDVPTERRAWMAVKACLESDTPKLGQNFGNYDTPWLLTKMGIRPRNYTHDLRLLHKALYPELPAGLGFMANSLSDQGAWKAWAQHAGQKVSERTKRDE